MTQRTVTSAPTSRTRIMADSALTVANPPSAASRRHPRTTPPAATRSLKKHRATASGSRSQSKPRPHRRSAWSAWRVRRSRRRSWRWRFLTRRRRSWRLMSRSREMGWEATPRWPWKQLRRSTSSWCLLRLLLARLLAGMNQWWYFQLFLYQLPKAD